MALKTRIEWPSEEQALENAERMRVRLAARLAAYEKRYGVRSVDVLSLVQRGQLTETHDVCSWLMAIDALESLGGG